MRAVLAIHRGKVKIWSKTGRDVTRGFPELAALAEHAGRRTLILDGVIFAARRLSDYCPPDKLAVVEDTTNPIGP